jgi:adenosine kinase
MKDLDLNADDLVVISPNAPDAMIQYALECQELGVPYVFDPSQQIVRLDGEKLKAGLTGAKALFANAYEFELLQKHCRMSSQEILQSVDFALITQGELGSIIYENGEFLGEVPVFPPKQILDPTGVGDSFRAGFLKAYVHGFNLMLCGKIGALAATYCLEEKGPQSQRYSLEDFITRFRTQFDDAGALDALIKD